MERLYWKAQDVIVPTLKYSQDLYEDVLKARVDRCTEWLDLGCGHHILPPWRSQEEKDLIGRARRLVGIDYDLNSLTKHKTISLKVRANVALLPFRNSHFGLVTANMVVEHLDNPVVQFQEINRVLQPGGLFIFHTPNGFGYTTVLAKLIPNSLKKRLINLLEGRKEEDIFDTYYRANTRNKISEIAKITGFQVEEIRMIVTCAQFAMIPPLGLLELVWLRILMADLLRPLRPNIIAILKKPSNSG